MIIGLTQATRSGWGGKNTHAMTDSGLPCSVLNFWKGGKLCVEANGVTVKPHWSTTTGKASLMRGTGIVDEEAGPKGKVWLRREVAETQTDRKLKMSSVGGEVGPSGPSGMYLILRGQPVKPTAV